MQAAWVPKPWSSLGLDFLLQGLVRNQDKAAPGTWLRRQYQISHEVRRGTQRASHVVLGTSGLRACGEGVT